MENRLRQYSSVVLVYEIFGGFWVCLGCDKILSVKFMVTALLNVTCFCSWRIWLKFFLKIRGSRSLMFFKIAILKNFAIFTRKHLGWSLFLIKLQSFRCRPETPTQLFSCEYYIIFKNSFFLEHLRWLLLEDDKKRNL